MVDLTANVVFISVCFLFSTFSTVCFIAGVWMSKRHLFISPSMAEKEPDDGYVDYKAFVPGKEKAE